MDEIFSQSRMDRCLECAVAITQDAIDKQKLRIRVRPVESIEGMSIDDLRLQYISVGYIGRMQEMPFTDALVVITIVNMFADQMRRKSKNGMKSLKLDGSVKTAFTDQEVIDLLRPFGFSHEAQA